MAIERLIIERNWTTGSTVSETNWDNIRSQLVAWSNRVDNNLKQIGLDVEGTDYEFNNVGRATQSSSIVGRLDSIDLSLASVGFTNLGLNIGTAGTFTLQGASATLSSTNVAYATYNSTTTAGQQEARNLIADISLVPQGAHWGFGTGGDLTDQPIFLYLIDTGSTSVFGLGRRGGRSVILAADAETTASNCNAIEKVFVSGAVASNSNCIEIGYMLCDFDDTGHAGGEDYWTIAATPGVGDVVFGQRLQEMYIPRAEIDDLEVAQTMTLATGSITDSSGAIDFGDEDLSTTGIITF